jgi:hypothetical protein
MKVTNTRNNYNKKIDFLKRLDNEIESFNF